jgi:maleate isomerase
MFASAPACTSAAIVVGDQALRERLRHGNLEVKHTTTVPLALSRALRFLKGQRGVGDRSQVSVALAAPYTRNIAEQQADDLARRGFKLAATVHLDMDSDYEVARLAPEQIINFARHAVAEAKRQQNDVAPDAVFISCTQLQAVPLANGLEEELGVAILTSNQVMTWDLLRLAGIDDPVPNAGRLMSMADRSEWYGSCNHCVSRASGKQDNNVN